VACGVVLAALFVVLARRSGEMVTFRVINRSTQTPVTDVHLVIVERWTTLPIDKLGLRFLSGWRTQKVVSATGTIKIPIQRNQELSLTFNAPRYHHSRYSLGTGEALRRSMHTYEVGDELHFGQRLWTNKEEVVVELRREIGGFL
jgi:hypothetical protein